MTLDHPVTLPPPRRILRALSILRQRVRRGFVLEGVAVIACGVVIALIVSFLLDYFLRLPQAVRTVLLLSACGLVAYAVVRRIIRPLGLKLPDDELAVLVERSHPQLRERLLTAVELTKSGAETARYVSSSLLDAVIQDVEARVAEVQVHRVLKLGHVKRRALLVIVLGGLIGFAVTQRPDLASVWFQRNLLLAGTEWPQVTKLELVEPRLSPVVVAIGDDLPVAIRALRGQPSRVTIHSLLGDDGERIDTMAESTRGLFHKTFPNVSRPFSFNVEGGDATLGPIDVEVRLRPRIDMSSLRIWCEYPAYLELSPTPEDEPIEFANLKVPMGTRVRFAMATNVPVQDVYVVVQIRSEGGVPRSTGDSTGVDTTRPGEPPWPAEAAERLEIVNGRDFRGGFVVSGNGHYYFQLQTPDGFRSENPDKFRIEAIPDRKPTAEVVIPAGMTEEVTAEATVTLGVEAADDRGIKAGSIEGLVFPALTNEGPDEFDESEPEGQSRSIELTLSRIEDDDRVAAGDSRTLPLARGTRRYRIMEYSGTMRQTVSSLLGMEKPPKPGARFQFFAQVKDIGENVGESDVVALRVVTPEELMQSLNNRIMVIRDRLEDLSEQQESTRSDLESFQRELQASGELAAKDAHKLYRHEREQERIRKGLEDETAAVARILERAVDNKVGDSSWREWVSGVRDGMVTLTRDKAQRVEDEIETLRKATAEGPRQLDEVLRIVARQIDLQNDLEMLILQLSKFGDINALIQRWHDIRRRQVEIRDDTRNAFQKGSSP